MGRVFSHALYKHLIHCLSTIYGNKTVHLVCANCAYTVHELCVGCAPGVHGLCTFSILPRLAVIPTVALPYIDGNSGPDDRKNSVKLSASW